MCAWRLPTLDELRGLSNEEIEAEVNELLVPEITGTETWNIQPADVSAAEYYIEELDRRENRADEAKRDRRETRRWRIDFALEMLIVVLIGLEIGYALYEGGKQLDALNKLKDGIDGTTASVARLQTSTDETVKSIGLLNDKMQSLNDLYYEPSVPLTYDTQKRSLELRNNSRTNITVFAVGISPTNTCLVPELHVSIGELRRIEFPVVNYRVRLVLNSDAPLTLELYVRMENGMVYRSDTALERWSLSEGVGLDVHSLGVYKVDWKHEYAERSKLRYANKLCSVTY